MAWPRGSDGFLWGRFPGRHGANIGAAIAHATIITSFSAPDTTTFVLKALFAVTMHLGGGFPNRDIAFLQHHLHQR